MKYKDVVKKGYDSLNKKYQEEFSENPNTLKAVEILEPMIPNKSKILDLGVGTGVPVAKILAQKGHEITGVDISKKMLNLAKKNVPGIKAVEADFCDLPFKKNYFDVAITLFSFLHLEKKDFPKSLKETGRVLKNKGILLLSVNKGDFEGYSDFLGEKMFFTAYSEKEVEKALTQANFEILKKYFADFKTKDETEHQMFFFVKKK